MVDLPEIDRHLRALCKLRDEAITLLNYAEYLRLAEIYDGWLTARHTYTSTTTGHGG